MDRSAKVLITGATGFVGATLARMLVEDGHDQAAIRALVRPGSPRAWLLDGIPVQRMPGTLADRISLAAALRDCDVLFHSAAHLQTGTGYRHRYARTNVDGTRAILDVAREMGVQRTVVVSSIAATAMGSHAAPATEASPFDLACFRLPYLDTKREQEMLALAASDDKFPVVVVNPGFIFGPGDVKPVTGSLLLAFAQFAMPLVPAGSISSVDVRDVARGMILAADRGRPGTRYILAERSISYLELGRMAAALVNARAPLGVLPRPLAFVGGLMADAIAQFTGLDLPISSNVALYGASHHCTSGARATSELGLQYRPLPLTLADSYSWFEQHGYLKRSTLRLALDSMGLSW